MNNFEPLPGDNISSLGYTYNNLNGLDRIYLTPNSEQSNFALNGIVLENDQNGIIYHAIGVNGARFSDYNKCSLFFDQIQALQPDLIIVSLGTNEAFGRLSACCILRSVVLYFFRQSIECLTFLYLVKEVFISSSPNSRSWPEGNCLFC